MNKLFLNLFLLFFSPMLMVAQNVGISVDDAPPHSSAILDVASKDKGILIPRVALQSTTDIATIKKPATSLLVYNTSHLNDLKPGFYYFNGTVWAPIATANNTELSLSKPELAFLKAGTMPSLKEEVAGQVLTTDGKGGFTWSAAAPSSSTSTYWEVNGNLGTVSGTNFIGTKDNQALDFRTNNNLRVRLTTKGQLEFYNSTNSIYIGFESGDNAGSTARENNALGYRTLLKNIHGKQNSAIGNHALYSNNGGNGNHAIGYEALYSNHNGDDNIAMGTTSLYSNQNGMGNVALGNGALYSNIVGGYNIALGIHALHANINGSRNIALGSSSLKSNTYGVDNIALGEHTLSSNTFGNQNIALGSNALFYNTSGRDNIALGWQALHFNTKGNGNTAVGYQALNRNTSDYNTAYGYNALMGNTTGYHNVSTGYHTLRNNTAGFFNSAHGAYALESNSTGRQNTANGGAALWLNTTGTDNSAHGTFSLGRNKTGSSNTASGVNALHNNTSGNCNTAVGFHAFYTGASFSNSTALGCNTAITASDQIRLGSSTVTSIGGIVDWTELSDARLKSNVEEKVAGLEFIKALRPVTYNLDMDAIAQFNNTPEENRSPDAEAQKAKILQTGFIAQEVEAAAKKFGYDFSGVDAPKNDNDYYGLRYAKFTVPLVKAVQELAQELDESHQQNEALTVKNKAMQTELEALSKQQQLMEKELAEIKALLKTTASK